MAQGQCTVLDQNVFVRDTLREMYLWYQELPDLDPALYPSPEAYLDAVRFRPQDETFSYISSAEATSSFYSESQYIGPGVLHPLDRGRLPRPARPGLPREPGFGGGDGPRRLPGRHRWNRSDRGARRPREPSTRRSDRPRSESPSRSAGAVSSERSEAGSSPSGRSPSPPFRRRRSSTSTGFPSDTCICATSSSLPSERSMPPSPSSRHAE